MEGRAEARVGEKGEFVALSPKHRSRALGSCELSGAGWKEGTENWWTGK